MNFQVVLAQLPQVSAGHIVRLENFSSQFVKSRNVDVWLPPGYDSTKKYPVLYMHDGQMLFDSTRTWTKQEWQVDETLGRLILDKKIAPCLVVGIWNSGKGRFGDYLPEKPYFNISENVRTALQNEQGARSFEEGKPVSDNYLKFIVFELMPAINKQFKTKKGAKHTFIAGSSMGGLISWYALCEYPKVFGGAACLSTHWTGIYRSYNNPFPSAFMQYLSKELPASGKHRIYFDFGTATLDSLYKPFQLQANMILKKKGYKKQNWVTLEFQGEAHTETAWGKRFDKPILFLMSK